MDLYDNGTTNVKLRKLVSLKFLRPGIRLEPMPLTVGCMHLKTQLVVILEDSQSDLVFYLNHPVELLISTTYVRYPIMLHAPFQR